MPRFNKLAMSIGAAMALGYASGSLAAIPEPGAVAESYLALSNFTILAGDQMAGTTATGLPGTVTIVGVTTDANVDVDLNGTTADDDAAPTIVGQAFDIGVSVTSNGGSYSPNVLVPFGNAAPANNINTGNVAGAHSSSEGNATDNVTVLNTTYCGAITGDCIQTHSQVNLSNYNQTASGASNQNFDASFLLDVQVGQWLEMAFDAEGFLRAALGQVGIAANAEFDWSLTIAAVGGGDVLTWDPDGETGGIEDCNEGVDCIEYSDAFELSDNVGTGVFPIDTADGTSWPAVKSGRFEIEAFLGEGAYILSIAHSVGSNAAIGIPEPGTLALMGLGLFGLGAARRRKAKS